MAQNHGCDTEHCFLPLSPHTFELSALDQLLNQAFLARVHLNDGNTKENKKKQVIGRRNLGEQENYTLGT